MKRTLSILLFTALSGATYVSFAQENVDTLAARLAEMRAEVETLSTRVEEVKQTQRADSRSLATQKADLQFQVQREEGRMVQLRAQAEKQRERVANASKGSEELLPALQTSTELVRARIKAGLPFKTSERLGELDAIEQKLKEGVLTPQRATVQLWALVEDELRLGRENGIYRQVIELQGEDVLVDVARLGMVAMYFRADDGRVGWAERKADQWVWVKEESATSKRQIELLFDAMSKQIRTGYFELPGPMGGVR